MLQHSQGSPALPATATCSNTHIEEEINRLRAELLRKDQDNERMQLQLAAEKEERERAQARPAGRRRWLPALADLARFCCSCSPPAVRAVQACVCRCRCISMLATCCQFAAVDAVRWSLQASTEWVDCVPLAPQASLAARLQDHLMFVIARQ